MAYYQRLPKPTRSTGLLRRAALAYCAIHSVPSIQRVMRVRERRGSTVLRRQSSGINNSKDAKRTRRHGLLPPPRFRLRNSSPRRVAHPARAGRGGSKTARNRFGQSLFDLTLDALLNALRSFPPYLFPCRVHYFLPRSLGYDGLIHL